MLYESEILIDLAFRVTGHACCVYTGVYKGLPRNQRRQAVRDRQAVEKRKNRKWLYHQQVQRLLYWIDTWLLTQEEMKERYGERLFVNPWGYIIIARHGVNHDFLMSRGYLPAWLLDIVKPTSGRSQMMPWPPKSQRKLCRWQLPPRGKQLRQRGGLIVDSIPAVSLFPSEWRVKEEDEAENGKDGVV